MEESKQQDEQGTSAAIDIDEEQTEAPTEPSLTPEEERDQFRDKYMRALADLENLRRRSLKERHDLLRFAAEKPLTELFPILDNLQRAVEHASADPAAIVDGVRMILHMADQALERMSVTTVGHIGEKFDPNLHDALQQMGSDTIAVGHVLNVFERGYKLHERLLRPAKVVVSTGAQGQAELADSVGASSTSNDLSSIQAELEDWEPSSDRIEPEANGQ